MIKSSLMKKASIVVASLALVAPLALSSQASSANAQTMVYHPRTYYTSHVRRITHKPVYTNKRASHHIRRAHLNYSHHVNRRARRAHHAKRLSRWQKNDKRTIDGIKKSASRLSKRVNRQHAHISRRHKRALNREIRSLYSHASQLEKSAGLD